MKEAIGKLVSVKDSLGNIANRVAGLENFLCDMKTENESYRLSFLVNGVQSILDDLEENGIRGIADTITELKGGSA